jgi:hypothetical protein
MAAADGVSPMSECVAEPEVLLSASVAVATGLLGGYLIGRLTKRPGIGEGILAGVGVLVGTQWLQNRGPSTAAALGSVYLGAIGLTHLVARRMAALPVLVVVSSAAAFAAYAWHDRYVAVGLDPAEQP